MKSGFVSVVGRTNSGKSSLINFLLDEKIAFTSHKQNATRRKIQAIIMHENNQLIFIDTPGLHKSKNLLNQMMIESAIKSIQDCDVILFVASIFDKIDEYENFLNLKPKFPHIILLNKVDLAKNEEVLNKLDEYAKFSEYFKAILPFSCKQKTYKKALLDELCKYIPEHPHFFNSEFLSTNSQKELFKDFILEAIFENVSEELPYSSEVLISNIEEKKELLIINANIITDTNSHKAMLIGKDGLTLKRIGKSARFKIEKLAQCKVLLKLFVQVKKHWQKDESFLKELLNLEK
ncbi:GTPase Era [Campylobacter sp. LR291e]|uniref:GTPase Era n=1 Tax=unclassified Campylobacter TaxID=2593542 RepID=UPI001237CFB4|nr:MULTISPECIES: GTPase Era [unclassified Campylobacter]KAA6220578.1 GTPase Era [Campylobacter sp. LR185c]KAA6230223.1 GTPase Era [Campylobacter sp. LR291e]KAA8604242.1 GTPase Era [Campylobacter sp. LR185c]